MIHQDDRETVMQTIARQMENGDMDGMIEVEYRVQQKNGAFIWVLDKGKKVRSADGHVFYCMLLDVTKRKREREELRLSLERHQIIMNQTQWDIIEDELNLSSNWHKKFGYAVSNSCISEKSLQSPHIYAEDYPTI